LDVASKYWVTSALGVVDGVQTKSSINVINNVISFRYSENTGASWGLFAGKTTALTICTGIAMALLLTYILLNKKENKFMRLCLVMILGGGLGNFYDRVVFGYVRDFIYTEFISFPTYNVADSFLSVATVLLMLYALFFMPKELVAEQKALESERQSVPPAYPYDEVSGKVIAPEHNDDRV
jgi:lipoprotein signal peptidase